MPVLTITGTSSTQDTYLDKGSPTANSDTSDQSTLIIGPVFGSPNLYRSLIKFDLSGIPAGSVINSAVLSIYTGTDFSNATGTIEVYRVKRAWVENQATWNVYSSGNSWGTVGCDNTTSDREASNIGTASSPGSTSSNTLQDITLTASSVQEMLTGGTFTNNGFLLKQSNESSWDSGHTYRSSEYAVDTTKIPKLVVTYSPAASMFLVF